MVKIEIFYNGNIDKETPEVAEDIKYKFGKNVSVFLCDTNEETIPEKYGILNPPVAIIDGKKIVKITGRDSLEEIVSKVIF
jgi:hypothetical protein